MKYSMKMKKKKKRLLFKGITWRNFTNKKWSEKGKENSCSPFVKSSKIGTGNLQ